MKIKVNQAVIDRLFLYYSCYPIDNPINNRYHRTVGDDGPGDGEDLGTQA